jgi:hypothetical protein
MATLTASGVNFSDGTTINGTGTNTIGSYVIAHFDPNNVNSGPGYTTGGGNLSPCNVSNGYSGPTLPGSWRLQGRINTNGYGGDAVSLWVRYA